jgi:hypothetical protein
VEYREGQHPNTSREGGKGELFAVARWGIHRRVALALRVQIVPSFRQPPPTTIPTISPCPFPSFRFHIKQAHSILIMRSKTQAATFFNAACKSDCQRTKLNEQMVSGTQVRGQPRIDWDFPTNYRCHSSFCLSRAHGLLEKVLAVSPSRP